MNLLVEASTLEWANLIVGAVGAFGTILALVVAIALGMHEVRQIRRETSEREDDRKALQAAQERTQAERISAVARVDREPRQRYSIGHGQLADEPVHYAYADVINASAQPIYEVKVLYPHKGRYAGGSVGFVPGGEKGHLHLPPQPDASLDGQALEVAFRDAGERWWSRCPEGHLHPHDDDPYPTPDDEPA